MSASERTSFEKPALVPRDYQIECIYAFLNYLYENETGNTIAAMPTGSGKAIVIAGLIQLLLSYFPHMRIMQLVDSQELVEQNHKKLLQLWPNAPAGVYCAGLDKKEIAYPIIFGSLGSVRNNIPAFGFRHIIIIDEVQGVSPDEETGYRQIVSQMNEINPNLRVVGLSATIYRMGQGLLTEGDNRLFDDVCFDITQLHPFNRLIAEGYLSPPIARPTSFELDVSNVGMSKGDFAQGTLQKAVDKQEITFAALRESVQIGYEDNRHCWLVFASGVEHCEHIAEMLQSLGISATFVHSKITKEQRKERLEAFKTAKIKALVGYKVLVKGFDHPPIDMIIDLYPTVSTGNHVQKYGRGTRPYDCNNPEQYIAGFEYTKRNCRILDFAANTKRLGPINDPRLPRKKGDKVGEMPIKTCEAVHDGVICGIYNHPSARYCGGKPYRSDEGCGAEFIFKTKLLSTSGTAPVLAGEVPTEEIKEVTRVIYHKHTKIGSEPSIKVSYYSGLQKFSEWQCPQHKGFALTRFKNWWRQRHASEPPTSTDEALLYVSQLRVPKRIKVMKTGQYYEVTGVEWD